MISWNNIENERIVVEGEHKKSRRTFFIYYIIDQDQVMKFDIESLDFGMGDFEHTLTIHRNRFERQKNS